MALSVRTVTVAATETLLAEGGAEVYIFGQTHSIWVGGADVNDSDRGAEFSIGQGNNPANAGGTWFPYQADVYAVKASGEGATVTVKVMEIRPGRLDALTAR